MRIVNPIEIIGYINEHEIKNKEITVINDLNKTLITMKDVIAVFTTSDDNSTTLNFEVLGNDNSVASIDIDLIDSYYPETQLLKLKI